MLQCSWGYKESASTVGEVKYQISKKKIREMVEEQSRAVMSINKSLSFITTQVKNEKYLFKLCLKVMR